MFRSKTRNKRKPRNFRPMLSGDLETRVVPSTINPFASRQALVQQRHSMFAARRQSMLGARASRFANLGTHAASRRFANLTGPSMAYTGFNTTNFANLSSPYNNSGLNYSAYATPGAYGYNPALANISASTNNARYPFSNTARTGLYHYGYGNHVSNATFGNNVSNLTYSHNVSNRTYGSNLNNITAGYTNPYIGNMAGTGISNSTGPFTYTRPSVTSGLYANPRNTGGLGGYGLGASYATTGAYNFGSLYNTLVGSGAIGGPFSAGYGGIYYG